ncbi:ankyrin repeat-containing domain protein [Obelidium mucronatum]|nr:ankyrin repeat-containing domain protein [Obelidium mucronatum]
MTFQTPPNQCTDEMIDSPTQAINTLFYCRASIYSLPFEILQAITQYLPINRTTLVCVALASKTLFATSIFQDLFFARNHFKFQYSVSKDIKNVWAFLDSLGIKCENWASFPLNYQAAIYGEILNADDWSGIRGWSGSDMTRNLMWYKRWRLEPTRALRVMSALLADHYKFNPSIQKNRALRWAARSGHLEVVRLLISDGRCDPTDDDNYACQCAAESGEMEILELLLNIPAQESFAGTVDPSANDGYAIKLASRHGHALVVERLLQDPRIDPSVNLNEALRNASENGHAPVVHLLLQHDKVDPGVLGNRPLKDAARLGHSEVVNLLLQDARVNPALGPRTPLFFACSAGHAAIVKRLLEDGRISPGERHNEALWKAAENGHDEVVTILMADERVTLAGWGSDVFQAYITTHLMDPASFDRIIATFRRLNGEGVRNVQSVVENGSCDLPRQYHHFPLLHQFAEDEEEEEDDLDVDFDDLLMDEDGWTDTDGDDDLDSDSEADSLSDFE